MKSLKTILIMCALASSLSSFAQSSEVKTIESTILAFAKAGDNNNTQELAKHLDLNYRIVMNQLFGSSEVSIMPRAVYLEKIKSKEFGGDRRTLTIENVNVNGNTASALVTFAGAKMTFVSTIILVKNNTGIWKLVCETPVIKK